MQVKGTYFQNDKENPLVYGDINLINPPRRRLRGEEEKEGILAETVIAGFCGTDHELMRMGSEGLLDKKFPEGAVGVVVFHTVSCCGSPVHSPNSRVAAEEIPPNVTLIGFPSA